MLAMTHNTSKMATMDCGSCVTVGALALHDNDVLGQSLIKKWGEILTKVS